VIRQRPSAANDQGATLIYLTIGMVGLMAFSTIVIDFGLVHVARRQAQNSADAAAYAAAVALSYDADKTDTGAAKQNALAIAQQNLVWGEAPSVLTSDVTFPTCPDGTDFCVRVAVFRTDERGNAIPTVFGRLLGLMSQDVRAAATAEVRPSNLNTCLKPWALPDRWSEVTGNATFEKYDAAGTPLTISDFYAAPSATSSGTGYRLNRDFASSVVFHQGCSAFSTSGHGCPNAQAGYFLPVNLAPGCPGASYLNAIVNCATTCAGDPVQVTVNQQLTGLNGVLTAQTQSGVLALQAMDPNATFNPVTKKVENSCVGGGGVPYTCATPGLTESPRIVAIPAFDLNWFEDHRRPLGGATINNQIKVSNILSVFIDGMSGTDIQTHVVTKSGPRDPNGATLTGGTAFTRTLLLVR